jgi:hypothetical protein
MRHEKAVHLTAQETAFDRVVDDIKKFRIVEVEFRDSVQLRPTHHLE